jgi:hypothetical protein
VSVIDKLCSIPEFRTDLGTTQQQDVSTDHGINDTDNVLLNNVTNFSNVLGNLNDSSYENNFHHSNFASNDVSLSSHKDINHNLNSTIEFSDYYVCHVN